MRDHRSRFFVIALLLGACDGAPVPDDAGEPLDAAIEPLDAAIQPALEIGVGAGATFAPIMDGDELVMREGGYGGEFVTLSLHTRGLERRATHIEVDIRRASDDEPVISPFRIRLSLNPVEDSDALGVEQLTITTFAEPGEHVLSVAIEDTDGVRVEAQRRVVLVR